jgi:hypothetical protein
LTPEASVRAEPQPTFPRFVNRARYRSLIVAAKEKDEDEDEDENEHD